MARALSGDIRERIFRYVNAGYSRRAAAEKFAVAASTAIRIMARHAASGTLAPKSQWHGRRSKLDAHRDYLARRIIESPDITLPELASELMRLGVRIDPSNLSRWFIRNGYSFKKNTIGQRTRSP
jgi:transposase